MFCIKGMKICLNFVEKLIHKVILGINSDKSVKLNKGPKRPINKLSIRIKNIKKKNLVDEIIYFNQKTPLKLIKKIKPDVIIKGSDYEFNNISGSKLFNVIRFKKK